MPATYDTPGFRYDGPGTYDSFTVAPLVDPNGKRSAVIFYVSRETGNVRLGVNPQQPNEILDYDIDYNEWMADRPDVALSVTVTAEPGLVVFGFGLIGNVCRAVIGGGVDGQTYKVTVRLTTSSTPQVVKENDFLVRIREV